MNYLLLLVLSTSGAPYAHAQRSDVYHLHFAKAVPGKAADLAKELKTQDPKAPMKGHLMVLQHQDGADWDYAVLEHLGTKATVEVAPSAPAPPPVSQWHTDTFVSGPPWAAFAKAMGLDQAGSTKGSVYVLSVYRAVAGHRSELDKVLSEPPAAGDKIAGTVVLQHLEGGPWQFASVTRYASWADFAASESNSVAQSSKGSGGWFQIREHSAYHDDTLAFRITQ
ncbi:MAG: hypothetical protein ABI759_30095 [Candidatus Solibacter sp.]